MHSNQEKPIFFIFQDGFKQISLPPEHEHSRNREMIDIVTCYDGVDITTKQPLRDVLEKLNEFTGRKIVNIHCDTNDIEENGRVFGGAILRKSEYGSEYIYLKR